MRASDHLDLFRLEETYWWFVGRRELVRQMVRRYAPGPGRRIVDAGCGTGGTMGRVADLGDVAGCDLSPYALSLCGQRGLHELAVADVTALPFRTDGADVAVSCDVLEHVDDDREALSELLRVLRPGGIVVLTVPAHQALWSEHDEALAHRRRYSARGLRRLIEECGGRVEKLSPVVSGVFLPILMFRLLQRLRPKAPGEPRTDLRVLPGPVNQLFILALRLENWLLRFVNLPVGTSLVAVARKP